MAREFICNLGTGRDFSTPATWEAAAATDLTAGDILAFIVTGTPDSYAAGQTVIGDTSGATGTVHCAIGEDGYLCLTGVSGTFTAGGENLTLSGGSAKLTTTDGGDTPVMVLECYNDTTYGAVDISTSWTTSATNRGIIRAASGSGTAGVNYHGGDPTVGVLFSYGGSASTIKVASDRHFSLERVRFTGTGSYPAVLFDTQSTSDPTEGVLANQLIMTCTGTGNVLNAIGGHTISNSLIIKTGSTTTYAAFLGDSPGGPVMQNCGVYMSGTCNYGVYTNTFACEVRNTWALGSSVADFYSGGGSWGASSNNASGDSTVTGESIGTLTGITTAEFFDYAGDDWQPTKDSVLAFAGADLSAATVPVSVDLQDHTRTARAEADYDIGPFNSVRESLYAITTGSPAGYLATYTTVALWDAAQARNCTLVDEQVVGEVFDDWPSGLLTSWVPSGFTSSEKAYHHLRAAPGEGPDGSFDAGAYLYHSNYVATPLSWTRLTNLRVKATGSYPVLYAVVGTKGAVMSDMMVHAAGTSSGCTVVGTVGTADADAPIVYQNCVVKKTGSVAANGIDISYAYYYAEVLNCTIVGGFNIGISSGDGTKRTVTNTVARNNNVDFYGLASTPGSNNASGDSTAPGSSSVTGVIDSDFVDFSGGDYQPSASGALTGAGADLSAIFTDDVTGTTRSTPWDIGAFIAAVAVGTIAPIAHHHARLRRVA